MVCRDAVDAAERLLAFLAVTSLFIGGTGFFKTYMASILLGIEPSMTICLSVFLVSFSVYTLDKLVDLDRDVSNMPSRKKFLYSRRRIFLALALSAYIAAALIMAYVRPAALPLVFVPVIANAFYGMRLLPWLPRLKDIPVMKNIVVGSAWAVVTVLIPVLYSGHSDSWIPVLYFIFIKTFIDTVLYDIRDVAGDRISGVRTMPVILGEKLTVLLLLLLNTAILPVSLLLPGDGREIALALTLYGYAYIAYLRRRRNPAVLDLLVEGEWMMASVVLYMLNAA
ncbi:MAG: UbiA family prenyltransferase [Methanothrix sp.]|jgi:4-hydroxybenzoate polyprenyltransferase|uniref:UbiA family prenyltransferase n=1 Tax=Methanothrix sp. TaxID=90426 RepID=UPI00247BE3AB|nr:UbiA family prenyltransferase [Methanothrix sp.]